MIYEFPSSIVYLGIYIVSRIFHQGITMKSGFFLRTLTLFSLSDSFPQFEIGLEAHDAVHVVNRDIRQFGSR
ncbi:MAG: hypothetical protein A2020_02545 [Lentisphaerae bacterium GWF2_45_14]|nr:MAG: hypothetical protein A2020_02545 [Lentisphaerae bacterium GWF2_45_14]